MATLGQLQRLFSVVAEEEQRYWSDLIQLVDDLCEQIGVTLGIHHTASELMSIGLVNTDGKFIKASSSRLKRVERDIEFAVQVVLSQQQSLVPPNILISEWLIKQTSVGIQLTSKDGGISLFNDVEDVAAHIADVFELMITSHSPYVTK